VTDESLRAFLSKNRLPIIVEFTQESAQKIFGGDQKLHLLLFVNKTKSDAQTLIDTLREAAPKYHGKVSTHHVCYVFTVSASYVACTEAAGVAEFSTR